jgi:hypothetical protein
MAPTHTNATIPWQEEDSSNNLFYAVRAEMLKAGQIRGWS